MILTAAPEATLTLQQSFREYIDEMNIPKEHLNWCRDLHRYDTVPQAGFDFDRIVYYITGIGDIRDVIPFPRTPKNIAF